MPTMARDFANARKLLQEIMDGFGVDRDDLKGKCKSQNVCEARQAYIVRAGERRIPVVAMARALGMTTCGVSYRRNPAALKRRALYQRRYRAAKTGTFTSAIAGGW